MKIKIINICWVVIITLSSGCSDWLDTLPPDGLVFNQFWKTKEDVSSVLMGAYGEFAKMDEKLFLYGEIRADLIDESNNTPSNERQIMNGDIFPENSFCNYANFYRVINYCNNVIKYAPEVKKIDITFSEFEMQSYISEALALRALAYFYLVRLYKDVPFILEPSDNDDSNFFPAKTDGEIILKEIKEDLKFAVLRLNSEYGNIPENKGRFSPESVSALLGDICLWNFEYEEALTWLNDVNKNGDFFIQPSNKWFEIFNPGNSLEGIFEFQFDNVLGQNNTLYNYTWIQDRYKASEYALSILFPLQTGENIRGRGTISREQTGYKIWKYCGAAGDQRTVRPSSVSGNANFIIYRYADILLMKAEAYSQLERFDEALEIINTIRTRALMPSLNIPYNTVAFETAILLERAKELSYEGKRWFDLLRMGRRNNYQNKNKLIEILVEKVPSSQRLVMTNKLADPNGWYFPIYSGEIENNPNLIQNRYYE
ncbi:MAG: RagB/SusD family nutrient uptake outer membrane protein [bacterium]